MTTRATTATVITTQTQASMSLPFSRRILFLRNLPGEERTKPEAEEPVEDHFT